MRWGIPCLAGALSIVLTCLACADHEGQRRARLARAEAAELAGDLDGAVQALEQGLAADPRDRVLRLALAEHWMRRGRPGSARSVLEGMPSDVSPDEGHLRLLAQLALVDAPLVAAIRALARLDERGDLEPEARDALLDRWITAGAKPSLLARLPARLRVRAVERILEVDASARRAPEAWAVLVAGEPEGERLLDALLARALRSHAQPAWEPFEERLRAASTPRSLLMVHRVLIERGDWAEAEQVERTFLRRHGDHPERYTLVLTRARRESRSGSAEEGLRLAREAGRLRPDRADALVEETIALRALGRTEDARRALHEALLVEPDDPLARRLSAELDPPPVRRTEDRLTIEIR